MNVSRIVLRRLVLWPLAMAVAFLGLLPGVGIARAEPPRVVVSIQPLHGIVAAIAGEAAQPLLLLPGTRSAHGAALRPSQAAALAAADLVVWIGPGLESTLQRPIENLAGRAELMTLSQLPGLTLHALREGGILAETGDHGHDGEGPDPHLWLDPNNALIIADAVARTLMGRDPVNAAHYENNLARFRGRLEALDRRLKGDLASLAARPFAVFHDAFQYFERHYGLLNLGSLTIDPDRPPGARRLAEMRAYLADGAAVCLFSEPQFRADQLEMLSQGTRLRRGRLDPLGAGLEPGPEAYFTLLEMMAADFGRCLLPDS